ncbi:hypothetical protein ACFQZX_01025 [Mucilaginibacter litoreus]|uniref:Uncharacterized protein n=1 Tax=Mucilaginibacter litoreus TaxID=1048221 RepID=A0ABW3AMH4_9SPHI
MRKYIIASMLLLSGLLLTSCVRNSSTRTSVNVLLKTTVGIPKDIGTAD